MSVEHKIVTKVKLMDLYGQKSRQILLMNELSVENFVLCV